MRRRVSAVEEYIGKRVEERMEAEVDVVLACLENQLDRETFFRDLEIVGLGGAPWGLETGSEGYSVWQRDLS